MSELVTWAGKERWETARERLRIVPERLSHQIGRLSPDDNRIRLGLQGKW